MAGALASGLLKPALANASSDAAGFISAMEMESGYAAARIDADGEILKIFPLPDRGHDIALSPLCRKAVVFSRRPGNFAVALDLLENRIVTQFSAPDNRHFYGHGLFSPDGNILLATENDFEGERGVLGIYDAQKNYLRIGEYDCYGIGPHEAILLSDQNTIACAIGGIATHPDYPRQKLNLADMAPSLVYLDRHTGNLVEQVFIPTELHKLSLRHIVEGPDRTVWFCGQYEGSETDARHIVGYHKAGRPLRFIKLPTDLKFRTKCYAGSIAVNSNMSQIAVSFPRGNFLALIDTRTKELSGMVNSPDICGIAGVGNRFYASNGTGQMILENGMALSNNKVHWDNHLRSLK